MLRGKRWNRGSIHNPNRRSGGADLERPPPPIHVPRKKYHIEADIFVVAGNVETRVTSVSKSSLMEFSGEAEQRLSPLCYTEELDLRTERIEVDAVGEHMPDHTAFHGLAMWMEDNVDRSVPRHFFNTGALHSNNLIYAINMLAAALALDFHCDFVINHHVFMIKEHMHREPISAGCLHALWMLLPRNHILIEEAAISITRFILDHQIHPIQKSELDDFLMEDRDLQRIFKKEIDFQREYSYV